MKRKILLVVFVLLVIVNIVHEIMWIGIDKIDFSTGFLDTLAYLILAGVLFYIMNGGLLYLGLPALVYFLLSKKDSRYHTAGYTISIITLLLQIVFAAPVYIFIALSSSEGGYYWISLVFYLVAALLIIAAILYSKICLKIKLFGRRKNIS